MTPIKMIHRHEMVGLIWMIGFIYHIGGIQMQKFIGKLWLAKLFEN